MARSPSTLREADNGTLSGGVTWTSDTAPGSLPGSYALQFDGVNGYVDLGSGSQFAPANFTISFWTKNLVTPAQYDGVIGKSNGGTWSQGWGIFYNSSTQLQFFVEGYTSHVASAIVAPAEWNYITGTWDGNVIRLYVNGLLQATVPYSGSISTGNLFALGRLGSDTYNIYGVLDDVRFYIGLSAIQK